MSEENVELVLRAWEAWQQGEPWDEFLDPEFEWDLSARASLDFPVRGRGREDYVQLMERYRRAWIDYEMAPKELIDAGENVVVLLHETTRARGTEGNLLYPRQSPRSRRAAGVGESPGGL